MSDNNMNENQGGFSVNASYPFVNEIISTDSSVNITNPEEGSGLPVDLSLNFELHESLTDVLEYVTIVDAEGDGTGTTEDPTRYLKLKSTSNSPIPPGVLCVRDNKMQVLQQPEAPAVLVVNEEGNLEWLEVPVCENGDDYALGTYNGCWYWYHIGTCAN